MDDRAGRQQALRRKLDVPRLAGAVAAVLLAGLAAARADEPAATPSASAADHAVPAITLPSERSRVAFNAAGVVRDRLVLPGGAVKSGQVLLVEDDRAEAATLAGMQAEASSTARVDYQKVNLALKETILARKKDLLAQNAAGQSEVDEAQNDVDLAKAEILVAQLDLSTKKAQADAQAAKVEMMKLRAPFDGIVESIEVQPGEMADPAKPNGAAVVVKNDPLWVELHLPTRQSQLLSKDQSLAVRYGSDPATADQPAKVIYIDPVADAASDTQLVRLELPNPRKKSSGLQVSVTLPDNVMAAAK